MAKKEAVADLPFYQYLWQFYAENKAKIWSVLHDDDVAKVYFTGMLAHGQTEFYVRYIDPETKTLKNCSQPHGVSADTEQDGRIRPETAYGRSVKDCVEMSIHRTKLRQFTE